MSVFTLRECRIRWGRVWWSICNLRCWPYDTLTYTDKLLQYDSTTSLHGFGAIDARKPVIRLKDYSIDPADSFEVASVSDTSWHRMVRAGDTLSLKWLDPGAGAMYRITPHLGGISDLGTAFNNAVRAINPSNDQTQRNRLLVYSRDSVVYLRSIDSAGTRAAEWMISDSNDLAFFTAPDSIGLKAYNINPALAVAADGKSIAVAWERIDPGADSATIRYRRFDSIPGVLPEAIAPDAPLSFDAVGIGLPWRPRTPAVVGTLGPYVLAWGSSNGIRAVAIENSASAPATSTIIRLRRDSVNYIGNDPRWNRSIALDSTCGFPSLASLPTRYFAGESSKTYYYVHLAFQQGKPDEANGQFIIYTSLVATSDLTPPLLSLSAAPLEHVTNGITGCGFLHPSIAVDSLRVGVAFQTNGVLTRAVTLRFRDSLDTASEPNWVGPAYFWAGMQDVENGRFYEWPSLVEFPGMARDTLTARPEGGLAWVWTNAPGGAHRQYFYRYADRQLEQLLDDGEYPSMMNVPFHGAGAIAQSGILYRGDTLGEFLHPELVLDHPGQEHRYYFERLANAPGHPASFFTENPDADMRIRGEYVLGDFSRGDCSGWTFHIRHWWDDRLWKDPNGTEGTIDPNRFRDPGHFFDPPDPNSIVTTISDAMEMTRSATFAVWDTTLTFVRQISGSNGMIPFLDSVPWDANGPADIHVVTELVNATSGSILWHSDTISGRMAGDSTRVDSLSVPLTGIGVGTEVFVRTRAIPSDSIIYQIYARFLITTDSTLGSFARYRVRDLRALPESISAIASLEVRPSPLRSSGVVHLRLTRAAALRLRLYDLRGRRVAELPGETVEAGSYEIPIDASALPAGIYLLKLEGEGEAVVRRIVVAR